MDIFNFSGNILLVIFSSALSVIFIIFLIGVFFIIMAREDSRKIKKGKKILLGSLYGFLFVLLITFVFFSFSYFLKRWERLKPSPIPGELPSSPAVNYPPPPQFVKIRKYYFSGPWTLKDNSVIETPLLYAILCQKDDGYDIIHIGSIEKIETAIDLLKQEQYDCWLESCKKKAENLYIVSYQNYSEEFDAEKREKIQQDLNSQINSSCPTPVSIPEPKT